LSDHHVLFVSISKTLPNSGTPGGWGIGVDIVREVGDDRD
jgi:hypothetical protein